MAVERIDFDNLLERFYREAYSYLHRVVEASFTGSLEKEASEFFAKLFNEYIGNIYEKIYTPGIYKIEFKDFKHLPLKVGDAKVKLELAAAVNTKLAGRNAGSGYHPVKVEFAGRFYIENLSSVITALPWFKEVLGEILDVKYSEIKDIVERFSKAIYGDLTMDFEEGHEKAVVVQLFRVDVKFKENGQIADIRINDIDSSYEENLWGAPEFGVDEIDKLDIIKRIKDRASRLETSSISLQEEGREVDAAFGKFLFLVGELAELVAIEVISLLHESGSRYLGKEG
jgi:hypothetical protein